MNHKVHTHAEVAAKKDQMIWESFYGYSAFVPPVSV